MFDGPSRVIDVGARRRFFTGALRRAIEIRDRTCYHPTCDDPPQRPEIDHIHQAAKGGDTTQANGRLACAFHNRWRNHHPDPDDDPDTGRAPPLGCFGFDDHALGRPPMRHDKAIVDLMGRRLGGQAFARLAPNALDRGSIAPASRTSPQ